MVYENKCSECGNLLNFGGEDRGELPDNAFEFNGNVYCRDCVEEFVEFGSGNTVEKVEALEEKVEDIRKELGLSDQV